MLNNDSLRLLAEQLAQAGAALKQASEVFASAQTPVTLGQATPTLVQQPTAPPTAPDLVQPAAQPSAEVAALAATPPAPGGPLTLEQFNVKVVELIRANPNRGPAAKQMLTRYAPNGGGAPEIDPAQYGNFIAELEAAQ